MYRYVCLSASVRVWVRFSGYIHVDGPGRGVCLSVSCGLVFFFSFFVLSSTVGLSCGVFLSSPLDLSNSSASSSSSFRCLFLRRVVFFPLVVAVGSSSLSLSLLLSLPSVCVKKTKKKKRTKNERDSSGLGPDNERSFLFSSQSDNEKKIHFFLLLVVFPSRHLALLFVFCRSFFPFVCSWVLYLLPVWLREGSRSRLASQPSPRSSRFLAPLLFSPVVCLFFPLLSLV